MTPRPIKLVPQQLMSLRMIAEECGITSAQARGIARATAREHGIVRIPGSRNVWFRRSDVERILQAAGAMGSAT